MILLIDNYDSFTYNLAQYLGQMGEKLKSAATTRSPSTKSPPKARAHRHLARPRHPAKSRHLRRRDRRFAGKIPILGVCLGHQAIG